MKLLLILLAVVCGTHSLSSQIIDDFADNDLTVNPEWYGDISDFSTNELGQLQLHATSAGSSAIFLPIPFTGDNLTYSLDCFLDFSPSDNNVLTLFVELDTTDLTIANGYAIQLGQSGNQDPLEFIQLINGEITVLGSGEHQYTDNPAFRLQVHHIGNQWTISSDSLPFDQRFTTELQTTAPLLPNQANYFGIMCSFTSTRTDKFRFDNLAITHANLYDSAPTIVGVEISAPDELIAEFSEILDQQSAENPQNYKIMPAVAQVIQATLLADPTLVQLTLNEDLPAGEYTIIVEGIKDQSGHDTISQLRFANTGATQLNPYDVVINEIFDDPTPSIGLPDAEYLELLVRKDGLNLSQLELTIGSKSVNLPDLALREGDYIALYDLNDREKFTEIENSIGVIDLPTLVNSGNQLQLTRSDGLLIHTIAYDDNWYRDRRKADGGWSLEQINPDYSCAIAENWTASVSLAGGTPGYKNATYDPQGEISNFQIQNIVPLDSITIRVSTNRSLLQTLQSDQFSISGGPQVQSVITGGGNHTEIILVLTQPLLRGNSYKLSISGISDCHGNPLEETTHEILIPEPAMAGDIVINEVLFDPYPGGEDFVELYNRSSKALLLSSLRLTNTENSTSVQIKAPILVSPGNYVVVTPDPSDLRRRYPVDHPERLIESDLPALPNEGGNITLFVTRNSRTEIIDAFDYSSDLHYSLLKETEGVSLERISPEAATQTSENWHSAAASRGFATPGEVNSQFYFQMNTSQQWQLNPRTFSPDGDGFDDYLLINYSDLKPGVIVHIKIFDAAGRLIRYLVNNQTVGTHGFFQWDGATDAGKKAPIGIYTLYIQSFNDSGEVELIKENCVVAARLN